MGRVKSLHYGKERIMSTPDNSSGYKSVRLSKQTRRQKQVHRLVAEAFIPNPMNLPIVNHLDGDKHNNCVSNLEWCTNRQNVLHAIKFGLSHPFSSVANRTGPKGKPIVMCTKQGIFVSSFLSATEAAKILGISRDSIYKATNNRCKYAHGYVFRFAE